MTDLSFVCPHCEVQITIENDSRGRNFLGFVFRCPHCNSPISWQAGEGEPVELSKEQFENFRRAVGKKGSVERNDIDAPRAETMERELALDDTVFNRMLKDIREADNYDDFLKRIG